MKDSEKKTNCWTLDQCGDLEEVVLGGGEHAKGAAHIQSQTAASNSSSAVCAWFCSCCAPSN
jgi:hypothetical protein